MDITLTPQQQEAVTFIGRPVLVAAGAGSGKTRTLTAKIAYLVNSLGYDPERILAITFTNKAAEEMKRRLEAMTGRPARAFPWVRTFHSACFHILKEHCELLGYTRPLSIHSEHQQRMDMKKALAELDIDTTYLNAYRAIVSRAKNSDDPWGYLAQSSRLFRLQEVFELYNQILAQHNAVDFDDILARTRELLTTNEAVRRRCQNLFDYVLVDEFQDSNAVQCRIMDLLLRDGNLTAVGDDYQSIYQFRGADPSFFIHFPKNYPQAKIVRLEENFRSTRPIVAAAEGLIAHNASRIEKKCFSRRNGQPVEVRQFPSDDDEARWVAQRCRALHLDRGIPFRDMAVLYRTKFCSMVLERAMRHKGVPYTMMGGRGFFERREVQDIHAYLMSAVNPKDDVAFERIINVPRRGLGSATLKKILATGGSGTPLQEKCRRALERGLLGKKVAVAMEELLSLLDRLRGLKPHEAIQAVVETCRYEDYLRGISEGEDDFIARRENIEQMVDAARQASDMESYLESCALIREDQDDAEAGAGVRLATFHAAKGLEFQVVFVIGIEEGLLPHWRSLHLEGRPVEGLGEENLQGLEEERRLLYVAMTRAVGELYLSHAMIRKGDLVKPSRFLSELPEECVVRRSW